MIAKSPAVSKTDGFGLAPNTRRLNWLSTEYRTKITPVPPYGNHLQVPTIAKHFPTIANLSILGDRNDKYIIMIYRCNHQPATILLLSWLAKRLRREVPRLISLLHASYHPNWYISSKVFKVNEHHHPKIYAIEKVFNIPFLQPTIDPAICLGSKNYFPLEALQHGRFSGSKLGNSGDQMLLITCDRPYQSGCP